MTEGETRRPKSRRWWHWPLIGFGIGTGLMVAIIVGSAGCVALLGLVSKNAFENLSEVFEGERVVTPLNFGQQVTIDGLAIIIDRFEISDTLRLDSMTVTPSPSTQYLWVHLIAKNVGDIPIDKFISVKIQYRGAEISSFPSITAADRPKFNPYAKLLSGTVSEGWKMYEVPAFLDPSQATAIITVSRFPVGLTP